MDYRTFRLTANNDGDCVKLPGNPESKEHQRPPLGKLIHMKKSTALAAIAASTFAIGAYNEQGHKEPTSTPVAEGQQSAHSIVDDLGIESGTYELTPTPTGSPETWEGYLVS